MITGARRKSLSLAGLMYAKVNALQAVRHRGNLSKPVTLRATDSGVQNAWQSFETITPAGKRSETDYLEDSVSGAGGGCGAHHTASYKLPHRNKKGLRPDGIPFYGYNAPAKSGARIGVLKSTRRHMTRLASFFVSSHSLTLFQRCGYNPCRLQSYGELDGGGEIRAGYLVRRLRQPCSAHHQ